MNSSRFGSKAHGPQISKHLLQLSGYKIPDVVMDQCSSANDLLLALRRVAQPKPTKVYDVLASDTRLANLTNVTIHQKRIKMHEKEAQVGRWKLIEAEFQKRGLVDVPRAQ